MKLDLFANARTDTEASRSAGGSDPVLVTRPALPPLEEFLPYLEQIWASRILTNRGPLHQQLEKRLCAYLEVEHLSLVANATLGLLLALRQLGLQGEVITTPYSFVATSHALLWSGLTPVFVDIDPRTYNLDPAGIEAAITEHTSAILPVHCYGRACDVDDIQAIADRHGLKVIYDAAHAFGVRHRGRSLLQAGDLSVVSFHATKVFNTLEGGAVVCPDAETKAALDRLGNYGIVDETTVVDVGVNAKLNEVSCAFGLALLPHAEDALRRRAAIATTYRQALLDAPGIRVPSVPHEQTDNHSYFPIEILDGHPLGRDGVYHALRAEGIHARRYFYPLLTDLDVMRSQRSRWRGETPIARRTASRILCLPIHPQMTAEQVEHVLSIVRP